MTQLPTVGGRINNYLFIFGVSAGLGLFGIFYSVVILKESLKRSEESDLVKTDGSRQDIHIIETIFSFLLHHSIYQARYGDNVCFCP